MQELPFQIPKSLRSYAEQFESSPEKAVKKLEKQVNKRGYDAVGHFLLAWFYHITQENTKAVHHALIAKTYAPGSPLMEHLHYFLLHPEKFDAHIPEKTSEKMGKKMLWSSRSAPVLDLDHLIAMLSEVEATRIRIPEDGTDEKNETDLSEKAADVDDIASETLAVIHEKQGKHEQAITMYERLIEKNSDKKEYFEKKIQTLKAEKAD